MTTLDEWVAELQALRTDLGPTTPMVMRWFAVLEPQTGSPLLILVQYLLKSVLGTRESTRQRTHWEVALYAPDAPPRARPVAVVDIPADSTPPAHQPSKVEVAGRVEAGGAVALVLPSGEVVYGIHPVRQNVLMGRRRL